MWTSEERRASKVRLKETCVKICMLLSTWGLGGECGGAFIRKTRRWLSSLVLQMCGINT